MVIDWIGAGNPFIESADSHCGTHGRQRNGNHENTTPVLIDGQLDQLLYLETVVFQALAKRLGHTPPPPQPIPLLPISLPASRFFGRGLAQLDRAKKARSSKEALPLLKSAILSFRDAQQSNGAFFASAHRYETDARERLAQQQNGQKEQGKIREETVRIFRHDAATAAGAFFGLGRALRAKGAYREATEAFHQYLNWIDKREKIIVFSVPAATPEIALDEGMLYTLTPNTLFKFSASTGNLIWRTRVGGGPLQAVNTPVKSLANVNISSNRFALGRDHIYVVRNDRSIMMIDKEQGKALDLVSLPKTLDRYEVVDRLYIADDESHLAFTTNYGGSNKKIYFLNASTEKLMGKVKTYHMQAPMTHPYRWKDSLIYFTGRREEWTLVRLSLSTGTRQKITTASTVRSWLTVMKAAHPQLTWERQSKVYDLGNGVISLAQERTGPGHLTCNVMEATLTWAPSPPTTLSPYPTDSHQHVWRLSDNEHLQQWRGSELLWTWESPPLKTITHWGPVLPAASGPDGRMLWKKGKALKQARIWESKGLLYALTTDKRLLCVAPPNVNGHGTKAIKRQHLAWIEIGRAWAAAGEWTKSNNAFKQAEAIQAADPELYWAWSLLAKAPPQSITKRFKLWDQFLARAAPQDSRRALIKKQLSMRYGLRDILPGMVLYRPAVRSIQAPLLVSVAGKRNDPLPVNTVLAASPIDGRRIWHRRCELPWRNGHTLAVDGDEASIGLFEPHPRADGMTHWQITGLEARTGKEVSRRSLGTSHSGRPHTATALGLCYAWPHLAPAGIFSPLICGTKAFITTSQGSGQGHTIECWDTALGRSIWKTPINMPGLENIIGSFATDQNLFLLLEKEERDHRYNLSHKGRLLALCLVDGKVKWEAPAPGTTTSSTSRVAFDIYLPRENHLFFQSDGAYHWLNSHTGKNVSHPLRPGRFAPPRVNTQGDILLAGTSIFTVASKRTIMPYRGPPHQRGGMSVRSGFIQIDEDTLKGWLEYGQIENIWGIRWIPSENNEPGTPGPVLSLDSKGLTAWLHPNGKTVIVVALAGKCTYLFDKKAFIQCLSSY